MKELPKRIFNEDLKCKSYVDYSIILKILNEKREELKYYSKQYV